MITHLIGTDRYRIKEYLQKHAKNAQYGESALKYRGLFGNNDPVVIIEPSPELEINDSSDMNIFVVYYSDRKPKKSENAILFPKLEDYELQKWITSEAKKLGFSITKEASELISQRSQDTWQAKLELENACNYIEKQSKNITEETIKSLNDVTSLSTIFQLTDAIGAKNKGTALLLLDHQLSSGADPYYLFSMIALHVRNLIAPNRKGLHPFVAKKALSQSRQFKPEKLRSLHQNLYNLERDAKSGKRDIIDGLYQFVFSLS